MNDSIHDGVGSYNVVLLIEQKLTSIDAAQIRGLHAEISDPVRYHLLLPVEDAAARVEAAMGSLAAGEVLAPPPMVMDAEDLAAVQHEAEEAAKADLAEALAVLTSAGADAVGDLTMDPPIDSLAAKVAAVDAREAIILTRPHLVAEFFHVDWTSRARRRLGVPVLHLLEHETFDEQAGGGEGVTGF